MTTSTRPVDVYQDARTNPEIMAALACPPWCVEDEGHDLDPWEINQVGMIRRDHYGRRVMVVRGVESTSDTLTVRAHSFAAFDPSERGLEAFEPEVVIAGLPKTDRIGLTSNEVHQLAGAMAEVVAVAESTDPNADMDEVRARGRLGLAAELVLADAGAPVTPELRSQVVDLLEALGGCIADDPIIDMVADVLVRLHAAAVCVDAIRAN